MNRKVPFGNTVQEQVAHLPSYEVVLEEKVDAGVLLVKVKLNNAERLKIKSTIDLGNGVSLLVGDDDSNVLLLEKYT